MKIAENVNRVLLCVLIIMSLVLIYHPIVSFGFANMDDDWMLLDDKMVHPATISLSYLAKLFTTFNEVQYSPGNTLYYHAIYLINGYDPYWYHIVGLMVHLLNVALFYQFIKQILTFFGNNSATLIAALSCLIWAVHPLNVESVIWISASKVLIYTTFILIALLSMLWFIKTRRKAYYAISFVCFLIACFCKEQALIFPVTLVLFSLIFYHTRKGMSIKSWFMVCLPFFLAAFIFGIVTIAAQQSAYGNKEPASLYSFFDRLIFSFYCLCFYIFNTVLPVDLHYQYNYPMKPNEALPTLFYVFPAAFFAIVGFCVYFIKHQVEKIHYWFWLLFFLVNISLCVQIVPMRRPAIMADRYVYIPILGLIVPILIYAKGLIEPLKQKSPKAISIALSGIGVLYFTFLIITSSQMAVNWQQYNLITK